MFTFNGFVQVSRVQTQAEGSILLLSNRKTVYPIRGLVQLGNDTFFSNAIQSFLPFNMKAKRNSNGRVHRWSSILLYLNMILLGHTCKALKHILVLARHHLLRIHSFCQAVNFLFKTKHCACFKSKNRNRCYIYNQTVCFFLHGAAESHLCPVGQPCDFLTITILRCFAPGFQVVVEGHKFDGVLCWLQLQCPF